MLAILQYIGQIRSQVNRGLLPSSVSLQVQQQLNFVIKIVHRIVPPRTHDHIHQSDNLEEKWYRVKKVSSLKLKRTFFKLKGKFKKNLMNERSKVM